MKFIIEQLDKSLWISIGDMNKGDLYIKEKFYEKLLLRLVVKNPIVCVTITPQNYSLGFDIKENYLVNVDGKQLLVNEIESCSPTLICEISVSEEFSRSLFVIVNNKQKLTETELSDVLKGIKERTSNSPLEMIFCENDGDSLCIRNSDITKAEVEVMKNEFETQS
jgi:hypothetical protein